MADLLLSQARGSRERLVHLFAEGDWILAAQASQFAEGSFPLLGAFWQRRILESCARILIDPAVFEHLENGRRLNVHAERQSPSLRISSDKLAMGARAINIDRCFASSEKRPSAYEHSAAQAHA